MQWMYKGKCDTACENIRVSIIKEVTFELDLIRTKVHMYSEAWNIIKKMFSLEPWNLLRTEIYSVDISFSMTK